MQYSVAGWYLVQAIYAVTLPFFMAGPMVDYMNQVMQQQAALNPNTPPPPADFVSTMSTVMTWGLAFAAAVGVVIATIVIIGALKRWTWLFYTVLVLLGLGSASFPFTIISALSTSVINPVKLPVGMTYASIAFGIPGVALFVWMLIAALRRGPWAMTRAAQ